MCMLVGSQFAGTLHSSLIIDIAAAIRTLTRCDLALTNGLNGLVKLVVGQSQPALESKLRTLFRLTRKRAPGPFRFHSRKLRGATLMKAVIPSCRRLIESAVAVVVAKLAARLGRPR